MTPLGIDSGMLEANGTRLYYEQCGSGTPLLFLHGFTLDRRMWERQTCALAAHYRCICYDARGFGRSALPELGAPYRHCDDAAALCEALGIRNVIAIGHSIGAHQLLELALLRPDLVAGYVSICGSGLAGIPFPDPVMQMFAAIRQAARTDLVEAKRIWLNGGWMAPAREDPEIARDLDEHVGEYSGWHWRNDNPAKNLHPPAAERLAQLAMPALIVDGGRDLEYNHVIAQHLAHEIPQATLLELPGASHMAPLDAAAEVNGALSRFAERIGAGS